MFLLQSIIFFWHLFFVNPFSTGNLLFLSKRIWDSLRLQLSSLFSPCLTKAVISNWKGALHLTAILFPLIVIVAISRTFPKIEQYFCPLQIGRIDRKGFRINSCPRIIPDLLYPQKGSTDFKDIRFQYFLDHTHKVSKTDVPFSVKINSCVLDFLGCSCQNLAIRTRSFILSPRLPTRSIPPYHFVFANFTNGLSTPLNWLPGKNDLPSFSIFIMWGVKILLPEYNKFVNLSGSKFSGNVLFVRPSLSVGQNFLF